MLINYYIKNLKEKYKFNNFANNQNYVISNTKRIKKLLKHIGYYRLVSITFIVSFFGMGGIYLDYTIIKVITNGTYITYILESFKSFINVISDIITLLGNIITLLFVNLTFICAVYFFVKYLRSVVFLKDFEGKDVIILK